MNIGRKISLIILGLLLLIFLIEGKTDYRNILVCAPIWGVGVLPWFVRIRLPFFVWSGLCADALLRVAPIDSWREVGGVLIAAWLFGLAFEARTGDVRRYLYRKLGIRAAAVSDKGAPPADRTAPMPQQSGI